MKNIKYVNNREILCCGKPVNDDLEESFDSAKDLTVSESNHSNNDTEIVYLEELLKHKDIIINDQQTMINIVNDQITLLKQSGILPNQLNPVTLTTSSGPKQSEISPHATPNIGNKIPEKEPYEPSERMMAPAQKAQTTDKPNYQGRSQTVNKQIKENECTNLPRQITSEHVLEGITLAMKGTQENKNNPATLSNETWETQAR
ncbi:hypothetical protein JTB14_005992 [Gonioctena quinquepunctata]|nr:hypothetical protein JTB14_005992 [Gonioctena quinquepunctata]